MKSSPPIMRPIAANIVIKFTAILIVTASVAWSCIIFDKRLLLRHSLMTPEQLVKHDLHLHQHTYLFWLLYLLIIGILYVALIEALTFLLKLVLGKIQKAEQDAAANP